MKKVWIGLGIIIAALGLAAGYISTTDLLKPELHHSPLIIAHRAGGGQWPQNSRTAVMNSIATSLAKDPAERYDGIEIDIVLTKDGHLVLSHDPWIHKTLCQTASGGPIGDRILIRDLTLTDLQSQFICGGVPDKDFSQVTPKAEKIMTLDEVLDALKSAPQMVLYLDVKIDGEITASAEAYARAISKRLAAARLRWFTKLRLRNPLDKARAARAGAVVGPKQAITWTAARQARDNGVAVVLFTPNTRKDLERYCTWPVDMLLTDYPQLGHCP
jgi:glycerophosphoryl diester phosphodiesterase